MPASFSWKPLYREIAQKLLGYRQRQAELIALLKDLGSAGLKVVKIEDEFADGSRGDLREIDPFTFFASFNRGGTESRLLILTELKKRWELGALLPEKFDGVPRMNAMNSWFIRYSVDRDADAVPGLWDLADAAFRATKTRDVRSEQIDRCLRRSKGNITSLTMGLFWFNPDQFLALDWKNESFARKHGIEWDDRTTSGETYLAWVEAVRAHFPEFASFSHAAHNDAKSEDAQEDNDAPAAVPSHARLLKIAPGENAMYWESDCLPQQLICVGWGEVGDLRQYPDYDSFRQAFEDEYLKHYNGNQSTVSKKAREVWALRDLRPGDLIAANRGIKTILAVGEVVEPGYVWDDSREDFKHTVRVKWDLKRSGEVTPQNSWRNVTVDPVEGELRDEILALPNSTGPENGNTPNSSETYTPEDAAAELFMSRAQLDALLGLLDRKKNVILQGPPGVGKTFAAERIAAAFIGSLDRRRIQRIQFHPSYGYEDFIQGIRPRKGGDFELQDGVFLKFCETAAQDGEPRVFIIDEINRGDLSKILGEAMMLIEQDKRGEYLPLMYEPERTFCIPKNVYVIGTMNTADRSISLVDYALRRRFAFHDLRPGFNTDAFAAHLVKKGRKPEMIARIREKLCQLNSEISDDKRNLGDGYQIGHSYFCGNGQVNDPQQWFADIITYEVEPLLREYWIDRPDRLQKALEALRAR